MKSGSVWRTKPLDATGKKWVLRLCRFSRFAVSGAKIGIPIEARKIASHPGKIGDRIPAVSVVHHLTGHGGLLSAGITPAVCFVGTDFRTSKRELQSAKVNSQVMDIPVRKAHKVCWIFTKLNGFLTRANGFSNEWHYKAFWKELEAPWKRDLQTPPFLLP